MFKFYPFTITLIISLLILLTSCSSVSKSKNNTKNKISTIQSSPIKNSILEKNVNDNKSIDDIINEAIKAGPKAVQYLADDLFFKANDASIRGDSQTAAFLYKHILKLKSDDYLRKKYATELVRLGELDEASKVLQSLFLGKESEYRNSEFVGLILAGVYTAISKVALAQKTYKQILVNHPSSEEACIFLAKSYVLNKDFKLANKLLSGCGRRSKNKAIFDYYRGKMAIERGRQKTARKFFLKALKKDPSYFQAALANGLMYEEKEQNLKAIATYKLFLKKNDDNMVILHRLVRLLFMQDGDYKGILPYVEKLVEVDPDNLNLKVRLGILYSENFQIEEAKGIFKEILVAVPSSDKVKFYLASLYQQTEDWELSLDYFFKIRKDAPLFEEGQLQIAQILQLLSSMSKEERRSSAEERFRDFVNLSSKENPELTVKLQVVYAIYMEELGHIKQALETMSSLRKEKDFDESHQYYLAALYERVGDFDNAYQIIEDIIKLAPNNAHALNFMGYSLLERGVDLDKAYYYISRAVESGPEDGYIRDSLGWYYYKTKQYKKALEQAQKAYEYVKTDVIIIKHLAMIHREMNNLKLSKDYYLEALRHCKTESEKNQIYQELGPPENLRLPASNLSPQGE